MDRLALFFTFFFIFIHYFSDFIIPILSPQAKAKTYEYSLGQASYYTLQYPKTVFSSRAHRTLQTIQ